MEMSIINQMKDNEKCLNVFFTKVVVTHFIDYFQKNKSYQCYEKKNICRLDNKAYILHKKRLQNLQNTT